MMPQDKIALFAHIGDIKENVYASLLVISALTELLREKGIISSEELTQKMASLDQAPGRKPA
ncbi:MAG: hypothetical protein AB1445_01995 [Bacillota bacterium]